MANPGSTKLQISKRVSIPANEIEITAMRSQGAGGNMSIRFLQRYNCGLI